MYTTFTLMTEKRADNAQLVAAAADCSWQHFHSSDIVQSRNAVQSQGGIISSFSASSHKGLCNGRSDPSLSVMPTPFLL